MPNGEIHILFGGKEVSHFIRVNGRPSLCSSHSIGVVMSFSRRDVIKSLSLLGLARLSGCASEASNNGVRLTKIRVVNFKEFEDVTVGVSVEYNEEEILNQVYNVKHKDGVKARPTTITDLPQEPGKYLLKIHYKDANTKSSLKITRPTYDQCSYVDIFLHDDGNIGMYVNKCGE